MDGKLLVLCGERPTVDEWETPIDEQGNPLYQKPDGTFQNGKGETATVDKHKRVLSMAKLLGDMATPAVMNSDMLFVDWETVMGSDISDLQKMMEYAMSQEEVPYRFLLDMDKNPNLMKIAHTNRLMQLVQTNNRPSIDYRFMAMEDFMRLFSDTVAKLGVVSILPAYPRRDDAEVNRARALVMNTWGDRNRMHVDMRQEGSVEMLPPIEYDSFGEVYKRASEAMMEIISKPYWFEKEQEGEER